MRADIWDSILRADKRRELLRGILSKENQIKDLPTKCGSCDLWMTSQCPRERVKKVSNGMPICNDFKQSKWVGDLILKLKSEVLELESTLNNLISK